MFHEHDSTKAHWIHTLLQQLQQYREIPYRLTMCNLYLLVISLCIITLQQHTTKQCRFRVKSCSTHCFFSLTWKCNRETLYSVFVLRSSPVTWQNSATFSSNSNMFRSPLFAIQLACVCFNVENVPGRADQAVCLATMTTWYYTQSIDRATGRVSVCSFVCASMLCQNLI